MAGAPSESATAEPPSVSESDRFVRDQNLERYIIRFEGEDRPATKETLRRSLVAEADRVGSLRDHLETADRLIERLQARLSDTLARARSDLMRTEDQAMAQRLVMNQCDLLAVIKGYREVIVGELERQRSRWAMSAPDANRTASSKPRPSLASGNLARSPGKRSASVGEMMAVGPSPR